MSPCYMIMISFKIGIRKMEMQFSTSMYSVQMT